MPSTLYLNQEERNTSGLFGQLMTMGAYGTMYGVSEAIEMQPLRPYGYYDNWKKMFGFKKLQNSFREDKYFRLLLRTQAEGSVNTKQFDPNLWDFKLDKDYKSGRRTMNKFFNKDYGVVTKKYGKVISRKPYYKNINKTQRGIYKTQKAVNVISAFEGTEQMLELGETLIKGLFINPIIERGKELAREEKIYFTEKENSVQTSQQQLVQSQQMQLYREKQDREIMNTYSKLQENQRAKSVENPYVMYRYY